MYRPIRCVARWIAGMSKRCMRVERSKIGGDKGQSSIVTIEALAAVPRERRVLVEQERMRREDGSELLRTVDMLAHLGKEAHPEHRQRLVVFLRVPHLRRKC